MTTFNRFTTACFLALLMSQTGCVTDREEAPSRDRAGADANPEAQRNEETVERAERRARDDRCVGREHDPDCQSRN